MKTTTLAAITLAVLGVANTVYAVPRVQPPEAPRRLELVVPKQLERLCGPASGWTAVLRDVTAQPSALTLRGPLSERAPSLTMFRFGGGRGLELLPVRDWGPCVSPSK